jgi:acetyl esterase/lipase
MMTSAPTTFLSPTLRQLLVCCLLLFALAGCSALKTISTVSPPAGESRTGIEFSERTGLKLDIHLPPPDSVASDTAQATIVFFYGGGWEDGTREKYRFVASRLTELGYIVVIPDYRKYPEVVFPAFVEDAAEAVNWVRNKIGNYGGNPSNIWLAGHSAGAQIAALLHYDETWLARGASDVKPCGLIGLSGPYDFLPITGATLKLIFPETQRAASQPVNYVDGSERPALLIHGASDATVLPRNSEALAAKVNASGGSARLVLYPDEKHAAIVLALAEPFDFLVPVATEMDRFIKANGCKGV